MSSIVVKTLSEQAYEILRERILSNDMAPSKPIRQDALSKGLGVSKIPLREALTRLEHDGLLISHPNRGFLVRPLTIDEAEDVFHLRMTVEPEAAADACKVATDEERAYAEQVFVKLRALSDECSPDAVSINRQFHLALTAPAKRSVTQNVLLKLHLLSERYVRKHLEPPNREESAFHEHQLIFDAWMARDAKLVKKLIKDHTKGTLDDLRQQLQAE